MPWRTSSSITITRSPADVRLLLVVLAAALFTSSCGDAAPKSVLPFGVSSPSFVDGGNLPAAFTCDGASAVPPVRWSNSPLGSVDFAVVMHHVAAPDDVHWYWIVYGLGPSADHVDASDPPQRTVGANSVNGRTEYTPPCSKGPGAKPYTITVYALRRSPTFPSGTRVTRPVLLDAIANDILAEASMTMLYDRSPVAASQGASS